MYQFLSFTIKKFKGIPFRCLRTNDFVLTILTSKTT